MKILEEVSGGMTTSVPVSDKLLLIQMQSFSVNLNIIPAYAPTADNHQDDINEYNNKIKEALS